MWYSHTQFADSLHLHLFTACGSIGKFHINKKMVEIDGSFGGCISDNWSGVSGSQRGRAVQRTRRVGFIFYVLQAKLFTTRDRVELGSGGLV